MGSREKEEEMTTIHDVAPRLAQAMRERNEEIVRKSWPVLVSELVNDFCGGHGTPTRFGEGYIKPNGEVICYPADEGISLGASFSANPLTMPSMARTWPLMTSIDLLVAMMDHPLR